MAGTVSKSWNAGDELTAAQMNTLETNLYSTQDQNIGNPRTESFKMAGNPLVLDADEDSSFTSDTDDRLDIRLGGVDLFRFDGTTASSVNGFDFIGAATTIDPNITVVGSDTNVSLNIIPKGTGGLAVAGVEIGSLAAQVFGG